MPTSPFCHPGILGIRPFLSHIFLFAGCGFVSTHSPGRFVPSPISPTPECSDDSYAPCALSRTYSSPFLPVSVASELPSGFQSLTFFLQTTHWVFLRQRFIFFLHKNLSARSSAPPFFVKNFPPIFTCFFFFFLMAFLIFLRFRRDFHLFFSASWIA